MKSSPASTQLARGKHIDFTFETSLTSKLLWVDTDKMEKVLANLLSNAFKFTPKGGKIRIALEEQGDETLLSVTDNGKGIAPDKLSKVFERFYTESDHRASGTGIGLHLTSEFVAMHHGRIEVESEPNVRTIMAKAISMTPMFSTLMFPNTHAASRTSIPALYAKHWRSVTPIRS